MRRMIAATMSTARLKQMTIKIGSGLEVANVLIEFVSIPMINYHELSHGLWTNDG